MKVLFVGGTGIVSTACCRFAIARGDEVTILNRGLNTKRPLPDGAELLTADVHDRTEIDRALRNRTFDVVVDFQAFLPEHVEAMVEHFAGRIGQYVFISTASAYQTPPRRQPITESTPLQNPRWKYAQNKIACEDFLVGEYRRTGFPITIVRPLHTYDHTSVPLLAGWTEIDRMRRGKEVVVHGDGTSLWTMTYHLDFARAFVGLLGNPQAVGDTFHITSDELLTWDQIYRIFGAAAGVEEPRIVHIASETIAAVDPLLAESLLGTKSDSVVFDNTKIKALVLGFSVSTPLWIGAREVVKWHDDDPARKVVDESVNATYDALVEAVGALPAAVRGRIRETSLKE
ncbi:SDR family oxidoreductase [Leifsonia sp. Root112D2]|uniref:SDR family oxidoreductase n=1 Tax=Leifsonia sp. Root112D2 TaxID=1736426 RepID=UPI0006F57949|nr:SDR family oxidoreductase [Leifsonia sp. Root112D2]KQV06454.1 NAD-dependent dehydratase [Leifsonia sp. Root112D2]